MILNTRQSAWNEGVWNQEDKNVRKQHLYTRSITMKAGIVGQTLIKGATSWSPTSSIRVSS